MENNRRSLRDNIGISLEIYIGYQMGYHKERHRRSFLVIFGDRQDIMGDLTWISYGILHGDVKEIFLGDIKDKSGEQ